MSAPSIQRRLMQWVLGALIVGAAVLVLAAYQLTLHEIDEVLDDSLHESAQLLADRDLASALPTPPQAPTRASGDTESMLVAIARRPDGSLLFTSRPSVMLRFEPTPGASVQQAQGQRWHVYTVVQPERYVQVAQPTAARREVAAETASELLLPLLALIAMIGFLLVAALRRGLQPLGLVNTALAQRSAQSLAPLTASEVPVELQPLVNTLNDLLQRLAAAFEAQRHFVEDAAHELRSPVTALQLQVQLLERSRDPAEQAAAVAELSAGITRARHLIEQLLDLSHSTTDVGAASRPAFAPVALGALVRAVVVRCHGEAERRAIDLGAAVEEDSVIAGDAAGLDILLGNLVANALRYGASPGVVDVVATRVDGAPALRVIDDGPGIPEVERARVYDRFYRSPAALVGGETGSGLGLAIVKAIAARHGAVVSMHDGPGGVGLEVRVVFPARR